MTNHPRRSDRRKRQLQFERHLPGLSEMARATTATADQMRALQEAARRAGHTWPSVIGASRDPRNPNRAVLLWGHGRLDVIDTRPLWQKEPA